MISGTKVGSRGTRPRGSARLCGDPALSGPCGLAIPGHRRGCAIRGARFRSGRVPPGSFSVVRAHRGMPARHRDEGGPVGAHIPGLPGEQPARRGLSTLSRGERLGGQPRQRCVSRGLLIYILLGRRPPQVPRERHLRLSPQRGKLPGHALLVRGGLPGGPPGGGQVDLELLRLAECPDQPVPQVGGLTARPVDKILDLAPVVAAPRHPEPFLRCRAGHEIASAASVILRRVRRVSGFDSDTSGTAIPSGVREAGRSHQPGRLPGSACAVIQSPAELMSPPDDPALAAHHTATLKGSDHHPRATSRRLCTPLCICPAARPA
jgi:hypothetical protein